MSSTGASASALCALAAEIPPRHRDRRLASIILERCHSVIHPIEGALIGM